MSPKTRLAFVTLTVGLATFMEVLDISIANVAVPTIAGSLGISANQGTWVITSYSVSSAIAVPLTGWLAKRFGEIRLFVLAIIGFTFFSAVCGLAQNIETLIFGRLLQGLVAGPMVPLSQSILLRNYPPEQKGLALGLWSMTIVIAPILGPVLGGLIAENYHWSWIFFINLPIGCFCVLAAKKLLGNQETPIHKSPIDKVGLMLLIVGVACLQLMLDKGSDLDWFNSYIIQGLGFGAALCLSSFIIWTISEQNPIVNLRLFFNRNFTIGVMTQTLGFMTYFSTVVIFPLWLQVVLNYSSGWAGYAMAPMGLFSIILSPIIGKNIHRLDIRKICSLAFCLLAGVSFWSTTFTLESSFLQLVLPRLVQGIGLSYFFVPISNLVMSSIPADKIAQGASLSNFTRVLSGAIGTTITTSLWEHRKIYHYAVLSESWVPSRVPAKLYEQDLLKLGLSAEQINAYVDNLLTKQSYMLATNDIFYLSGFVFLLLISLLWLSSSIKEKSGIAAH